MQAYDIEHRLDIFHSAYHVGIGSFLNPTNAGPLEWPGVRTLMLLQNRLNLGAPG